MKEKIVMILAVLVMAAPAMAAVNFVAEDAGSGQLKISYTCDGGEEPRGIALKVTLAGNNGHIESEADVISMEAAYNTYIDWANSNPAGYAVGDGHPLADPAGAGVVTFPASEFSICMGSLDETGNQLPGPGTCANLITIQLHGDADDNVSVTVDADYSRAPDGGGGGGAVGSTLDTNLPLSAIDVAVTGSGPTDCVKDTAAFYQDWLGSAGTTHSSGNWTKPDCWCYERNCHGEADGCTEFFGFYWVYTHDLQIMKDGYGLTDDQLDNTTICGNFDHLWEFFDFYAVYTLDFAEIKLYYGLTEGSIPICPLDWDGDTVDDYNFLITPADTCGY
jgi:hypothetical protein